MQHGSPASRFPTILFGAFDRHNLGDLLFPHILAAVLPDRPLVYAGLARRDLRAEGGHAVQALADLRLLAPGGIDVVHVGGELLTCSAWEAAVMLEPAAQAFERAALRDPGQDPGRRWAGGVLGVTSHAPYVVQRREFPAARRTFFHAVGGVDLHRMDDAMREEVLDGLRAATHVSVRDRSTLGHLARQGIPAALVPDSAALTMALFGTRIQACGTVGEVAQVRTSFPQGYLAVQCHAGFGDDALLDELAAQLVRMARAHRSAVVLFRAGTAPWHDDSAVYRRLAARLDGVPVHLFASLSLWETGALIAHSRAFAGSSLHGRILAAACALPRVSLRHPDEYGLLTKVDAYAATWEPPDMPGSVALPTLADDFGEAMAMEPALLIAHAAQIESTCRSALDDLAARLATEEAD